MVVTSSGVMTNLHLFGLAGGIRKGAYFLSETTVLYPAGNSVIIYNSETKLQSFIPISDDADSISAICVSNNKRILALGEISKKGMSVAIWDLIKMKKNKLLHISDCLTEAMVCISLCSDGKILLVQGGKPDWNIYIWNIDKSKLLSSSKATSDASRTIIDSTFQPRDPSVICVCGDKILRFLRVSDNNFKAVSINFMKRELQTYTCNCWINEEVIAVGTDNGEVWIFEFNVAYELKCVLSCSSPGLSVESMIVYSKGLVVGYDGGIINVFERSDENGELFKCSKVFKTLQADAVTSLQLSPSEDILLCSTISNQMLVLSLSNSDIVNPGDLSFEYYSSPFHGPGRSGKSKVTGLDICSRKPLVATCGLDRTVRLWNFLEKNLDLSKVFEEEALCLSFHPSGLQVAVSFHESVQLMNLLMTDIRPYKQFPNIKGCTVIRFSNGGHKFAAACHNSVYIHNFYSGELLTKLSTGIGAISSLSFSFDDLFLFTSNVLGVVSKWNLKFGTKQEKPPEKQYKSFEWRNIVSSHEHNSVVYGVGEVLLSNIALEAMMKEDPTFVRENVPIHMLICVDFNPDGIQSRFELDVGVKVGACVLSNNGKYLFISTCVENSCGRIRAYKLPITNNEYVEVICSGSPITNLATNLDDSLLFATSEDGCFIILSVKQEGRNVKRENLQFSEEILVTKSDLDEKQKAMIKLQIELEKHTNENQYRLNVKEIEFKDKIKQIEEKFKSELEENRKKFNELIGEKTSMEFQYDVKIKEIENKFKEEIEELEMNQNSKIESEHIRFEELHKERIESNKKWAEQNALLTANHDAILEEKTIEMEKTLNEEILTRDVLVDEKHEIADTFVALTTAIEKDAEVEVDDLNKVYLTKLTSEKNIKLRLRGENVLMRKKYTADKKVISLQEEEINEKQAKEKATFERIKSLEKDIIGHVKEIREREETITDKDKRIYELKKKNQELEKFKFVLDYKIKELRRQIEPRQNEISDMRSQMRDMDQELEAYYTSNASLDLMIGELKQKIGGMEKEYRDESIVLETSESLMVSFRDDLHDTVKSIVDYRLLKPSIIKLFKKYVTERNITNSGSDIDVQKEYNRQREYLEKSVESLKRKLEKDSILHEAEKARLMRENAKLTIDVNGLRRELHNTKAIRGIFSEPQEEFLSEVPTKTSMEEAYNPTFATSAAPYLTEQEAVKEIDIQRKEIERLRESIQKIIITTPTSSKRPLSKVGNTKFGSNTP